MTDTLASTTDAVVAPVTDTLSSTTDAVVAPLTDTLASTTDAVVAPVTDTLSSTTDAVVAPVTDTLASTTDAVVAPVTDTLSSTTDAVVAPVTDTLSSTTDAVVAPLTNTLASTTDTVVAPVTNALSPTADAVLAPVTDTLNATSGLPVNVVPVASEPAAADGGDAFGPAYTSSVDAGAAPAGDPGDAVIAPFSSHVDPGSVGDGVAGGPLGDGLEAIFAPFTSSIDVGTSSAPAVADAAPFALSVLEPPSMPASASGYGMEPDAVAAAATSVDGHSLTDVMTNLAPDARLLASAAALALASEAIVGARLLGSHADPRMAFTNVRLVPCLVKASVGQHVAAFTGGRLPATSMGVAGGGGSLTPDGVGERSAPDDAVRGGVRGAIETFVKPLRDGFDQATREATGEVTDGFSDTRLTVQIGMALGVVYVAFLSVWFWATRVRWGSRA